MKPRILMKNVLFLALPAMLLSGCGDASATENIQPHLAPAFTMQAEMHYGEQDAAQLTLCHSEDACWEVTFNEPPALAGIMLSFDGSAVSASYKGLAFTVPKSAMPAKNMLVLTTDILDSLGTDPLPCTRQTDGTFALTGDCDGGSYTLTLTESGEPAGLDIPSQPLQLSFSGYVMESASSLPELTTTETTTITTETTKETAS